MMNANIKDGNLEFTNLKPLTLYIQGINQYHKLCD